MGGPGAADHPRTITSVLSRTLGRGGEPIGRPTRNTMAGRSSRAPGKSLLSALSAAKTRFLVVGAYAVMHHTTPRYTKDLDLWVEPTVANAKRTLRALAAFGASLARITVDDLTRPGIVYQIGVEPVRADILTTVPGLTFRSAYRRAVRLLYADVEVRTLCLDDILTAKHAAGRPQDLLDVDRLEHAKRRCAGSTPPPEE